MIPEDYSCEGQIALWDYLNIDKREFGIKLKPYEYHWKRYLGQKLVLYSGFDEGKIVTVTKIEDYYTFAVDDEGNEYALTNTTCYPLEENETCK